MIVALALITISFRSPTSGALHDAQGVGSTILRPFQIAATRIAQPFRDAYDYVDGLANARAELKRQKKIDQQLRAKDIQTRAAAALLPATLKLLHFEGRSTFPSDFKTVNTAVISPPGGPFAHSIVIEAGSSSGVRLNDPVVSGDGLVGIVSNVSPSTAKVTLLSDPNSFVAARDVDTQVRGMVHTGTSGTLILDLVQKQYKVNAGDKLVTAGTHNARYPDLYPYGIPIGTVTHVSATDTATFLQVQVQPFASLGSPEAVAVLVPRKPGR